MVMPLYAALLGCLLVVLTARTIILRKTLKVGLGDGESPSLRRAIRVHGNFVEYVPFTLLLLFLFELLSGNQVFTHIFGSALFLGRISHAYGVSQVDEKLIFRQIGLGLNLLVFVSLCFFILYDYLTF